MANRRKRLERQNARKQDQALVDALALDLAKQGLPSGRALGGLPSVHDPLYYCVRSHLDGTDKDWNFGTRLGWLLHNLRANEWGKAFFHTHIVNPDGEYVDIPPMWDGIGGATVDPLDLLAVEHDNASE